MADPGILEQDFNLCPSGPLFSKSMDGFDCYKASIDKSAVVKASILAKAILNIVSNFIPNEKVAIDN